MLTKLFKISKYIFIVSIVLCMALVISAILIAQFPSEKNATAFVFINQQKISVEVADTAQKRIQGLSGRNGLPRLSGMLFIFDPPESPTFWMKDMKFNLDIVFIRNGRVVDVFENIPYPKAHEQPQTVNPTHEIDRALELPVGTVKIVHIKVGDVVSFSNTQ
jgi:uncharacterized membrane protein (UPF0127 family)